MMKTIFNNRKKNRKVTNVISNLHINNNNVQIDAEYYIFIKRTPM
jgi:hypothetical protein